MKVVMAVVGSGFRMYEASFRLPAGLIPQVGDRVSWECEAHSPESHEMEVTERVFTFAADKLDSVWLAIRPADSDGMACFHREDDGG